MLKFFLFKYCFCNIPEDDVSGVGNEVDALEDWELKDKLLFSLVLHNTWEPNLTKHKL